MVSGFARAERGGPAKATVLVSGEVGLELGAEDAAVDDKGGVDYTSTTTSVNTTLTAAPGESFVLRLPHRRQCKPSSHGMIILHQIQSTSTAAADHR